MKSSSIGAAIIILAVVGIGVGLWVGGVFSDGQSSLDAGDSWQSTTSLNNTATSSQESEVAYSPQQVIGQSVQGRDITAYTYGNGDTRLLFVGAIHGGYEWNSALLSYEMIDWIEANPAVVPENMTVSIIPQLNPDGVFAALGTSGRFSQANVPAATSFGGPERFNANDVDLNRNFGCNWQPTSTWRGQEVSAGTSAFSEPESRALRNYVSQTQPDAAVFFHSAAGAVYGATCGEQVGPGTTNLLNTYANASGYRAVPRFTAYPITGDVESWLTSIGIPAVSVELTNHQDTEWAKNRAGIQALFD